MRLDRIRAADGLRDSAGPGVPSGRPLFTATDAAEGRGGIGAVARGGSGLQLAVGSRRHPVSAAEAWSPARPAPPRRRSRAPARPRPRLHARGLGLEVAGDARVRHELDPSHARAGRPGNPRWASDPSDHELAFTAHDSACAPSMSFARTDGPVDATNDRGDRKPVAPNIAIGTLPRPCIGVPHESRRS